MEKRSWKLLEILNQTSRFFADKGLENPRLQAELLLADILGLRRLDLYLQFERLLTEAEVEAYRQHVRWRLQRVPLQQIIGQAPFRHLMLAVSADVLIPRPETEVLVEVALELLASQTAPQVLDLGCGSGAIAIAIACEHPTARVVATDLSPAALEITRRNVACYSLEGRVQVVCGDLFAPLRPETFDAIVSNPPYVPSGAIPTLAPEVRDHEPRLALDGGLDGLHFFRCIASQAADFLRPGGCLCLEVGDDQAERVRELLVEARRFAAIEVRPDLNEIPRVVTARLFP